MDESATKMTQLQAEVRRLEMENMNKDQEIQSLQLKLEMLEGDVDKADQESWKARTELTSTKDNAATIEILMRKVTERDEQLGELEVQVANLTNKSRSLAVEKENLIRGVDTLKFNNKKLEDDLEVMTKKWTDAEETIKQMEKQLDF